MQERLNRLYEQYGYRKFKMSRFEDYDLYAQNRDFLRQDRIITFTDADGALKALKPDITLSIMKSNGGDSEKVYYNENVCREVGGAFREILQVGVESVGQIDPYAEAEVIALAARSLEQLSPKYVLALSDVSFVGSLLDQMGLSAPVRGKVLGLIARKNVPGLCVLAERGELTGEQADGLRELVELYAPLKEGIGRVGRLAKSNAAWEALRQLSLTAGLLEVVWAGGAGTAGFLPGEQHGLLQWGDLPGLSAASTPRCSPAGGTTTCPVRWASRWGPSALPCQWACWRKGRTADGLTPTCCSPMGPTRNWPGWQPLPRPCGPPAAPSAVSGRGAPPSSAVGLSCATAAA